MISINLRNFPNTQKWIQQCEGFREMPYQGPHGNWNVGWGHNLTANGLPLAVADMIQPNCPPDRCSPERSVGFVEDNNGLSLEEGIRLLEIDIDSVLDWLPPCFENWPTLGDAQQGALVNMGFNMGPGTFGEFVTFRGFIAAGKMSDAAADLESTLVYRELTERYTQIANALRWNLWPWQSPPSSGG